jgi:hypothetical protein
MVTFHLTLSGAQIKSILMIQASHPIEVGYGRVDKAAFLEIPAAHGVSPSGSESLHPDLNHPPGKPRHWDYRDPLGTFWECYEEGTIKMRQNQ